jgi:hypothetical protein
LEQAEKLTALLAQFEKLSYSGFNPFMERMPMGDAPNKTEFLEHIRTSRSKLDDVIKIIDPMFMTAPGPCGDWSVKDVLAHITWHEQEMFNVVLNRALVGSDLWNVSLELRNKTIYEENRDRELKDVLDDYKVVFESMMDALETLTDKDLLDASHFGEMPSNWKPWEVIASNTYEHYDDHLTELAVWQEKNSKS